MEVTLIVMIRISLCHYSHSQHMTECGLCHLLDMSLPESWSNYHADTKLYVCVQNELSMNCSTSISDINPCTGSDYRTN